jgi:hypothetical protein
MQTQSRKTGDNVIVISGCGKGRPTVIVGLYSSFAIFRIAFRCTSAEALDSDVYQAVSLSLALHGGGASRAASEHGGRCQIAGGGFPGLVVRGSKVRNGRG